jgi:hypothetical protein
MCGEAESITFYAFRFYFGVKVEFGAHNFIVRQERGAIEDTYEMNGRYPLLPSFDDARNNDILVLTLTLSISRQNWPRDPREPCGKGM